MEQNKKVPKLIQTNNAYILRPCVVPTKIVQPIIDVGRTI